MSVRSFFQRVREQSAADTGPQRRESDRFGRLMRVATWLQSPMGALVTGAMYFLLAVVVAGVVIGWALSKAHDAALARAACERSSIVGPYLADDYDRRGVLPPNVARINRAAIPVRGSCD